MPKGKYTRKTTRKGWVRKLDKLMGDLVRLRDGRCVTCGSISNLEPGHLFNRIAYSTRWSIYNVFAQCRNCNLKHESDPYPFTSFFIKRFGQKEYDRLHRQYVTPQKFADWQLEELYNRLKPYIDDPEFMETIRWLGKVQTYETT